MGYGDDIMGSGLARGAADRGKRIAFGDGRRIIWGPYSAEIFQGNPNVAPPGHERRPDIEWIEFYKGKRTYSYVKGDRWVWNYDFRVKRGQIFFDRTFAPVQDDLIVIEPNVANQKSSCANRQWAAERFQQVADLLAGKGFRIVQPDYPGAANRLQGAALVATNFRGNLELLRQARLFIGPHGGLSHGAAAVLLPAVVLFGGWAPPQVLGYDIHENIANGEACGSLKRCQHCLDAMEAITVDQVMAAAERLLYVD
jgi:Glycosyltransferase family 9 (heptosyltransferase)